MSLATRNSVLAVVVESTEGTPVAPSAATDYTALQDGFTMTPSFALLENAELTGSIAPAKSVKGVENPAGSMSHYIRHSGVVAQAPDYAEFLYNLMGSTATRSTERDTVGGSTTTVVNVDAGEGAEFQRGDALLVKHASNAWEIRNVLSVSTDALTLTQALANAPALGVNLGRNVVYRPVNSGHPTHSVWLYRGNVAAGAIEMMSGARVSSMSVEVTAGEYINASFDFQGLKYYYDPIEITASDIYFDFDDGGGEENAVITAKIYRDPYELAEAVQTAMQALTGDTITVSYDDSASAGKFSISSTGGTLSLLWNTGTNAANTGGDKLGFSVAADDTGSTSYLADNAISKASPYTPSLDSADPFVAKYNEVLLGSSASQVSCFCASSITISVENTIADVLCVCAESAKNASVVSGRAVTVEISALLEDHQAEEFKNFRANDKMLFTFNCGERSSGNWVAGKTANFHSPTMVINEISLDDADGLVQLNMTLAAYSESGLGEFYINFL